MSKRRPRRRWGIPPVRKNITLHRLHVVLAIALATALLLALVLPFVLGVGGGSAGDRVAPRQPFW